MLWWLFWSFVKIGVMSFGGGYAMLPIIQEEVVSHQWMSETEYAQAVALVGMAPGPIAANLAVIIGYKTAGLPGSIVAASGFVLPTVTIVVGLIMFTRLYSHKKVDSFYYGLRPIIVAFVFYGAIRLAKSTPLFQSLSLESGYAWLIALAAFVLFIRSKLHPLIILFSSAIAGVLVFR